MPDYVYDDEDGKHPPRPSWLPAEGPGNLNVPPVKWGMTINQFCGFITWCKLYGPWSELAAEENDFGKTKGYVNLYQICNRYVKPYTRGLGNSIALLLNNKEPLQAQIMISHAWGECILETMAGLLGKASTLGISLETAIWFCTFAQYQPGDSPGDCGPGVAAQLALDPFKRVIESNPRYGMLVIHTSRVELYTRLWCVFEVNEAEASDVVASAAASMRYLLKMAGGKVWESLNEEAECVELDASIRDEVLQCDSQNAGCWSKDDAAMISAKVKAQGGFEQLDDKIFKFRRATMNRMWSSMKRFGEWTRASGNPEKQNMSDNNVLNILQMAVLAAANYVGLSCLIRLWMGAGLDDLEMMPLMVAGPEILREMETTMSFLDPTASDPPPGLDKKKYVFKGLKDRDAYEVGTDAANTAFMDIADLKNYPLALGLLEMAQGGNTLGALVSTLEIGSTITAKAQIPVVLQIFAFEQMVFPKLQKEIEKEFMQAAEQGIDLENLPDPEFFVTTADGKKYVGDEGLEELRLHVCHLLQAANCQCDEDAEKATEALNPTIAVFQWRVADAHDANKLDESSQNTIKGLFRHWDEDNSGSIRKEELSKVLKTLEPSFTDHDVGLMMSIADKNKDGQIDYNEFLEWLFNAKGGLSREQNNPTLQLMKQNQA